jgi:hypothetical protein
MALLALLYPVLPLPSAVKVLLKKPMSSDKYLIHQQIMLLFSNVYNGAKKFFQYREKRSDYN